MRLSRLLVIAATLLLIAGTSLADTTDYFTLAGSETITFNLPANPQPTQISVFGNGTGFTYTDPVSVSVGGTVLPSLYNIDFYNSTGGGAFDMFPVGGGTGSDFLVNLQGVAVYTNTDAAPEFLLTTSGPFTLTDYGPATYSGPFELTISATPEPGSLLLFGTGIAGVLGAIRRKFAR